MRKNVSLALCNHHSMSEGPIAPFVPGIIEIGGLEYHGTKQKLLGNDQELHQILQSQQQLIYFSFGSRVKWSILDPELVGIFVKAFKLFPEYTILWTYDKNCTELQIVSANIKCRPWWPQSSILASNNTRLFITHGGKGSISEVYRYAVPILGFPFFGDQRANVANMQKRGFGLRLDIYNLTTEEVTEALHQLLHHDKYRRNVAAFSSLYQDRPVSSEFSVVYWLEYVIRYKGAQHLRSPAVYLTFIEYCNLDVYVTLLIVTVVLTMVCNWLESRMNLFDF